MSNPAWPGTLPPTLLVDGFVETPPETVLRTEMDSGPAKVRRRYTANVRPLSGSLILTASQVAILDDFLLTTLEGGSKPFDWTHPRTSAAITTRFVSRPGEPGMSYEPYDKDNWIARLRLEILP